MSPHSAAGARDTRRAAACTYLDLLRLRFVYYAVLGYSFHLYTYQYTYYVYI